jgi:hypothetical protein
LHAPHKSQIAEELLHHIAQLYDIERQVQDLKAAERQQIRQKTAAPIMDVLYGWMIKKRQLVPTGQPSPKHWITASNAGQRGCATSTTGERRLTIIGVKTRFPRVRSIARTGCLLDSCAAASAQLR